MAEIAPVLLLAPLAGAGLLVCWWLVAACSVAAGPASLAPRRGGVCLAGGAGFVAADAAGRAGVHAAALGQELAQLAAAPLHP
jgi:hypothetical protein